MKGYLYVVTHNDRDFNELADSDPMSKISMRRKKVMKELSRG